MPPAAPTSPSYRPNLIAEAEAMLAVMTPEEIAAAVLRDSRFQVQTNARSKRTRIILPLPTRPQPPAPAKRAPRRRRGPIPDHLGL